MNKLTSFAEIVKKAKEEQAAKNLEKRAELTPLLSELFATVSKGKVPIVNQVSITEKTIVAVEEKAAEIQTRIDNVSDKETVSDTEKKFLKLFNKIQSDFQTLKTYVDQKASSHTAYPSTAGSGEVRILRMDDVDNTNLEDGSVMIWDASIKKFRFVVLSGGPTSSQSPVYLTFSHTAIQNGTQIISLPLTERQVSSDFDLMINGLMQSKTYYTVNTIGLNIADVLNVVVGDVVDFQYLQ